MLPAHLVVWAQAVADEDTAYAASGLGLGRSACGSRLICSFGYPAAITLECYVGGAGLSIGICFQPAAIRYADGEEVPPKEPGAPQLRIV